MIDIFVVPDRLKNAVGKPQDHDVLDRFLAQIMVDPEDLGLVKDLSDDRINLPGRLKVSPDGLLHNDSAEWGRRIRRL